MRVGVIGAGAMGQHHVRIYNEMENVELVGISDVSEKRVKELSRQYGIEGYTDHEVLLKQDLDAVSIVVPTTLHTSIGLDAINSGVNVIVEKPIADTLENAKKLTNAAKDAGVKLMVGHIERFNPAVTKLKQIIESGILGKIVSISTRRVGPYNPRIRDVGVILDIGVHDIDVLSYLYGMKVNEVYAIAGADIHSLEDHAAIILRFNHEYSGIVETNWLTPHKVRKLTAIGLKGVAYLDYIDQTVELHDGEWIRTAKVIKDEPLKKELQYFIRILSNDIEPSPSGEDGIHALKVATAAVESYNKGKAVKIEL
ncbi:putative dehydrogenase [Candidatus Methanoperedens nitroreducens]|uniref:Putative dehydrogenase n=1 Tax=Candidatus Methanoperedens nitratireducens TaxID=1392998 RepID=A0A062VA30_9EURY|nr:UDP-N-acetylglucosamine 3-dehydrogenase [Candidatus Methanoperedens nitroreducens]KCZ72200.1 putative dehydrogenase [Candidatus Methanoperedens nitroreducens]MDJ1421821.1 UDP-N-acetylglucosamine 3-dehydrogenase [Candidatus Methanoperedens sp.]